MNRSRVGLAVVATFGVGAIATGVVVGVLAPETKPETTPLVAIAGAVVVVLVGGWKLLTTGSGSDTTPGPWTESGALVQRPPEELPEDTTLSGQGLTEHVERAGAVARSAGSVEAGLAEIRPLLRRRLGEALVHSGQSKPTVEESMAAGTWTDDRTAAAVVDESVTPPERSLRGRFRAWLFPEREVQRMTRRAVGAIATAAEDALPPVVGNDAPRTVPVVAPTVDDLQRTADGTLQRAAGLSGADTWADAGGTSTTATDGGVDGRDAERGGDESSADWDSVDTRTEASER